MSKFKNLLLVAMVLCMVPMLAACNKDDSPEINIDNRIYVSRVIVDSESKIIPLVREATYKLKYSFEPIEATNKTVEFSSSNPSVATVNQQGEVTAVGAGSCVITIRSLDNKNATPDSAVVNVVNSKEKLSKPFNPKFDGTRLTWDEVTATNSVHFVPKYELTISCDNGEPETVVTTAPSYSNFSNGAYSVSLRTLGDDGNVLYEDSDQTSAFTFTKLGNPTDLSVTAIGEVANDNARRYVLSFTLANNTSAISDYDYRITPVNGGTSLNTSQQQIWASAIAEGTVEVVEGKKVAKITIPNDISYDPVHVVFGTKTDAQKSIYGSGFTNAERIQVGRLKAPTNLLVSSINDGTTIKNRLTWSNVPSADKYKLKVIYKNSSLEQIGEVVEIFDAFGVTSYDMSKLQNVPENYDSYEVFLYSLGAETAQSKKVFLDSDISVCAKQQLNGVKGEVAISRNETSFTIRWNAVTNAQSYKIYISDNNLSYLTTTDLSRCYNTEDTKFTFDFNMINVVTNTSIWNVGNNYIKILPVAEVNSVFEDGPVRIAEQKLIKLATPTLSVSKGVLVWNAVDEAENYTINFNNGNTVLIKDDESLTSYSYAPSKENFNNSSISNITISAKNTGEYYIESQTSQPLSVQRYNKIAQSSISIVEGELRWGVGTGGLVDEGNQIIQTNAVEIKVLRTSDELELKTISTSSNSLSIAEVLKGLDGDGFYSFSMRAVNNTSAGVLCVNGDWSEKIHTYQMASPSNLRVLNGVLTWDKVEDESIGTENEDIRYIVKLNDAEQHNYNLGINNTSVALQNLSSGKTYRVSVQTKITGTENITVQNKPNTYLINSLFSSEIDIRIVPKPINLYIDSKTLYWTSSGSTAQSYTVYLYKLGAEEPLAIEDNIRPSSTSSPSFDFSTNIFGQSLLEAGNYELVVQAIGDNSMNVSSYMSEKLEICKLETPVITINQTGVLTWNNIFSKLDNITNIVPAYLLTAKCGTETKTIKVSTNSTTLSDLTPDSIWCGNSNPLTISIQASSEGQERIYDSNVVTYVRNPSENESTNVTVYKLPQISPDAITIDDNKQVIQWHAGDYRIDQGYFNVMIYQKSDYGREEILVNTTVQADASGNAIYNISPNWSGMDYYIKIQQVGYEKTINRNVTRYITSEYSEPKFFTRLAEVTGIHLLSDENGAPVLNWQALQESENARYRVTLQKFNDQGTIGQNDQLVYYVAYDASKNSKYSLNLYTAKGYHNVMGENQDITIFADENGEFCGEYIAYVTVIPQDGHETVVIDGRNYMVLSSRISTRQIMTVYSAPSIDIDGSYIEIVNKNSSSKGVKLEFTEVVLSGSQYVPAGTTPKTVSLGANQVYYQVTESMLDPNKIYQVTTQALGNGRNLINSQPIAVNMLISKIAKLEPNTKPVTLSGNVATNTADFDGWYVKSGKLCWNAVVGATQYLVYMTNGTITKTVLEKEADLPNYSETLRDMGFATNFGAFKLQFIVKGGDIVEQEYTLNGREGTVSIGYLSSDVSDGTSVNKLFTPNGTYSNTPLSYDELLPNGDVVPGDTRTYDRTNAYARIDENGEFDFGIRDADGNWVDYSGATKYALSIVGVGNTTDVLPSIEYDLNNQTEGNRFIASDVFLANSGTYSVSMFAIGNDWYGDDLNKPIYLSSDAQNSFKIIYGGAVKELGVENGNIMWTDDILLNNYDLKYQVHNESEFGTVSLRQNKFDFEGEGLEDLKGKLIDNVYVRVKGISTVGENTAIEGYVNTAWNDTPLTKIMKLPDLGTHTIGSENMTLYINERGQLAWVESAELQQLQADNDVQFILGISREVTADNRIVQPETTTTELLSTQVYTVPRATESTTGEKLTYIYNITAQIKGSGVDNKILAESRKNMDSPNTLFLNSSSFEFSAGKLNNPIDGSFQLDKLNGSVRISWDLDGCSIDVVDANNVAESFEADTIMLTYNLDNDMTNLVTKILSAKDFLFKSSKQSGTSQKGGTAFWQLATFRNMQMTVLNSKGKAFGSDAIDLDTRVVEFKYFDSGTGTRNDPFTISKVEQLSYMYWLPEKYFKLSNDIKLPDLTTLQQTYRLARINLPYPKEFYDTNSGMSSEYRGRTFSGGFDGNGHTISNYQVVGSSSMSIWNSLLGTKLEPITLPEGGQYNDTVYQDYAGIITNLTVEVNTLNVGFLRVANNGILVANNAGVIYNCHIKGDNNKLNTQGNRIDVVEGKFNAPATVTYDNGSVVTVEYCIGGIAGMVSDRREMVRIVNAGTTNEVRIYEQVFVGIIEKCTNMLDLKIYNSTTNTNLYVGGIVGKNNNGKVVDCVNGAKNANASFNSGIIGGTYSGGIVGVSTGEGFYIQSESTEQGYTSEQYYSYNYGCINYGSVITDTIYSAENPVMSFAGGITGAMSYAYTTYSINYGQISTNAFGAYMGGLVGFMDAGSYMASVLSAGTIEYNKSFSTSVTGEEYEDRIIAAGMLCGRTDGSPIIYNSAYNQNSIKCFINSETPSDNRSDAVDKDSTIVAQYLYDTANVNALTEEQLTSNAKINDRSILIDLTNITVAYENLAGKLPQFKRVAIDDEGTQYTWDFEWVDAQ